MNIVLLHEAVREGARRDQLDDLIQVEAVRAELDRQGHASSVLPCSLDLSRTAGALRDHPPDLAFNLVESLGGHGRLLHLVPAVLDALGIRYTGAPTAALFLTTNKVLTKQELASAAIPTPAWYTLGALAAGAAVPAGRYILKPVSEDASVGVDDAAVIDARGAEDLAANLRARAAALQTEVFAESYIEGREFNVSLLAGPAGVQVLPPAEMDFVDYAAGKLRIVGYAAKWDEGSFEFTHTRRRFDLDPADERLAAELARISCACWELLGLRGFARVDYRVDPAGRPWVLELNANPCLSPDAGFQAAVRQAGLSFGQVVERIVADAVVGADADAVADAVADADPRRSGGLAPAPHRASAPLSLPADSAAHPARTPQRPGAQQITLRDQVRAADAAAVGEIVSSTGFFSKAEIDVARSLVDDGLRQGPASGYHFLFAEHGGSTVGYACFGPIPCTTSSYDLYWIAVRSAQRRLGLGRLLAAEVDRRVAALGGKRLYIDTSGRPQYAPTRAFYEGCGYRIAAVLEDFYAPGDDKVVYAKPV